MWLQVTSFFTVILVACSQECPDLYKRFSAEHTFCLPPNNACNILKRGVTAKDKELILKTHNDYRSRVATGQEKNAGGMPSAANMLEMVWDDELARVAQKHAETCKYKHDCKNCKRVQAFSVGQNIGQSYSCEPSESADWQGFIKGLYDEVSRFDKKIIPSYVAGPSGQDKQYDHFTQVVWAKSWRVGCGWTLYKMGTTYVSYKVCNYGPGGNVRNAEIYKAGPACSACPKNSCCGDSCKIHGLTYNYQGLCKVIDTASSPEGPGPHNDKKYLFYCDFNNQPDCAMSVEGKPWTVVKTPGGDWLSIVLKGGEKTKVVFNKQFQTRAFFCTKVVGRTYANVGGQAEGGQYVLHIDDGDFEHDHKPQFFGSKSMRQNFMPTLFGYGTGGSLVKYTFEYSVPAGVAPQFFEIKEISAYDGFC